MDKWDGMLGMNDGGFRFGRNIWRHLEDMG